MATAMLCLMVWNRRNLWPDLHVDVYVYMCGLLLALLCGPRGRPFWLFLGIAVGAFLAGGLAVLFTLSRSMWALYVGGFVIMAAIAWRGSRKTG